MRLLVYRLKAKLYKGNPTQCLFLIWEVRGLVPRPFSTPEVFSFAHDGGREELWETLGRARLWLVFSSKSETGNVNGNWKLDFACTLNHYFSMKFYRKLPWTPNNQSRMLSQRLNNSTSKCLHCVFSNKQNAEIDKLWLNFATSFTSSKSLRKALFISLMYLL